VPSGRDQRRAGVLGHGRSLDVPVVGRQHDPLPGITTEQPKHGLGDEPVARRASSGREATSPQVAKEVIEVPGAAKVMACFIVAGSPSGVPRD
jgi:hypothetical protein